jgi:hypothetical protein
MTNLQRRLRKLETWRVKNRVPRIVTRYEHPDGRSEVHESRPPEGDDDETIEIVMQFVDTRALWHRGNQPTEDPGLASDNAT